MEFEVVKCFKDVIDLMLVPGIKESLSIEFDESAEFLDYQIPGLFIYKLYKENVPIGFGLVKERTFFICEVEIAILPEFRGKEAAGIVKRTLVHFLSNHHYQGIMAMIKKENRKSLMFAYIIGLKLLNKGEKYFHMGALKSELIKG